MTVNGQPSRTRRGRETRQNKFPSLVRQSHIFASVVREILEIKLIRAVDENGLSLPQFHLLKLIALNGTHQIGQIAEFLGVSPPAATKNIDKLERLGLVVRSPCEGDRRATLVHSSKDGRELVRRVGALERERFEDVVAAFTTTELETLAQLLERFSVALLGSGGELDGLCLRCSAHFDDHCPIESVHHLCPYKRAMHGHCENPSATGDA